MYTLRSDAGHTTRGTTPEEAAELMRGLEDGLAGEPTVAHVAKIHIVDGAIYDSRDLADIQRMAGSEALTDFQHMATRNRIRLPNAWPRALPDAVAKLVEGAQRSLRNVPPKESDDVASDPE